jgi:hypothetical protein
MLQRRDLHRALAAQERSRAVHEEFLLAESGLLPGQDERLARLRSTEVRVWLRMVARWLEDTWADAPAGLGDRLDAWMTTGGERLEALEIDEARRLERRGLSGDPAADARKAHLLAHVRFFAEGLGTAMGDAAGGGPALAAAVGDRVRAAVANAEDILVAATATDLPERMTPEQAIEIATAWVCIQQLAVALEHTLGEGEGEPAA